MKTTKPSQTNVRRVWNPPNPFLSRDCELLEEPPVAAVEVYEDNPRSILSRNQSPDLNFNVSLNPYRGCFHGCAYCYARPTHEYLGFGAGSDFDRKIVVKKNAAVLLDQEFRKKSWVGELVVFSGSTDCYQPLEATYRITRACLEVCAAHRNPVAIITKSALVRRDLDVLARMVKDGVSVKVALSIPFADENTTRRMEPGAASVARRLETIRLCAEAGVETGVAVAPIIPGLNDCDIPEILERSFSAGARFAFRTLLRLPGSTEAVFMKRLRQEFPDRAGRIEARIRDVRGGQLSDNRFGHRHQGTGNYWDAIDRLWRISLKRSGIADAWGENDEAPAPRRAASRKDNRRTRPGSPARSGEGPRGRASRERKAMSQLDLWSGLNLPGNPGVVQTEEKEPVAESE